MAGRLALALGCGPSVTAQLSITAEAFVRDGRLDSRSAVVPWPIYRGNLNHSNEYAELRSGGGLESMVAAIANAPIRAAHGGAQARSPFQAVITSEESRLGREAIETAALKQLIQASVRVFFYMEDRERTFDSPTDKLPTSSRRSPANSSARRRGCGRTTPCAARPLPAASPAAGCSGTTTSRCSTLPGGSVPCRAAHQRARGLGRGPEVCG